MDAIACLDEYHERAYLDELELHCRWAHGAVCRFNELLRRGAIDSGDLMREALDFLNHCATVSRLLWPPRAKSSAELDKRLHARGDHLRAVLGIDASLLLAGKPIRSLLEHYEIRLDKWIKTHGPDAAAPATSLPERAVPTIGHYDPSTKTLSVRDQSHDVQALYLAVVDVLRRVEARRAWLALPVERRALWAPPTPNRSGVRNVLCPCGSGRRYKSCCGALGG